MDRAHNTLDPSLAQALLEAAPDALILLDEDANILFVNTQLELLFGYSRHELLGKHLDILIPERFRAVHGRHHENYSKSPHARPMGVGLELFGLKKDGSEFPVDISLSPIHAAQERFTSASVRDDTRHKQLLQSLATAKERAETALRTKAQFIANASHEIRTPLNAVMGMSRLLLDAPTKECQREYATLIEASGKHLLQVINDLLDFSKLEVGRVELESNVVDIPELLETVLNLAAATRSRNTDVELLYEIERGTPEVFLGDAMRLRQVLVNLLSNAIKFTSTGEILVSVSARCGNGDGLYEYRFAVRDTGVGILPDCVPRLFESFSQAEPSTTREYGGTGLGLAISKMLTERMGGQIGVESVPGQGSLFYFTVPVRVVHADTSSNIGRTANKETQQSLLHNKRVLCVYGNATGLRILAHKLASWGVLVSCTRDPQEANALIASGRRFDAILLDHEMPGIDGVTLANRIHANLASHPPLLLLTTRCSGFAEGIFAVLVTKPIRYSSLKAALEMVTGNLKQFQSRSSPAAIKRRTLKVLLVEDNTVNQQVALRMLEHLGYAADVVCNGFDAVEAVNRLQYDVVLMDVHMPELDGLQATRRICARWPTSTEKRPRIIAMTGQASDEDMKRCREAGMDDCITKPIQLEKLATILNATPPNESCNVMK